MELHPLRYPKALLDKAPEQERTLHLMAGHLANDLNIIAKLLIMSMNPVSGEPVLTHAQTAITMQMIRQLAGRLHEGWAVIQELYSPLDGSYAAALSDEAKLGRKKLKKYFGRANLVNSIRNKSAFHSDPDLLRNGYALLPKDEILEDYFSENYRGHCLFYGAEIVAVLGLTQLEPGMTWQDAIAKIAKEIIEVMNWLTDFILGLMKAFLEKYVIPTLGDISGQKLSITNGPPIDNVIIPFFASPPLNPDRDATK